MSSDLLVLYGAGGLAREIAWLVRLCRRAGDPRHIACFVSDLEHEQGTSLDGVPVVSLPEAAARWPQGRAMVCVGSPSDRSAVAARISAAGLRFGQIVHPSTFIDPTCTVGEGSVLQLGAVITVGVHIGAHVLLNGNLSVGHDSRVGDCSVLGPGTVVSGHVHIGKRALIGAGAVIREGSRGRPVTIGDDAVVGAGSVVLGTVPAGAIMAGVPARPLGEPPR